MKRSDSSVWCLLAALLGARALDHALFATWVFRTRPGWEAIFETGATYGLIDGALAIAAGVLLILAPLEGAPLPLSTVTLVDGLGRLVTAIALRAFPGLPGFFVTAVSMFGAVGITVATLGVVALAVWAAARRRRTGPGAFDALFDPLAIAAIISFAVGFTFLVSPPAKAPALRDVARGVCASLALVFLVASGGAA
ncbi:MAG TPA: hypothetical protein VII52_03965, partial [Gemmatimonadaceae bacterium]